jgi:UDP-N-acetylmuramate dehydrogenase
VTAGAFACAPDLPADWRQRLDGAVAALQAAAALGTAALEVQRDLPLARRTTFGIGGPADVFVNTKNDEAVEVTLRVVAEAGLPLFVLGGGSNLLVGDGGIRGVVLWLGGDLAALTVEEGGRRLRVGCGCTFPRLTKTALDLGWPGALGWMGTPGQVGGAVLMNAGSKDGELGDDVVEVTVASARGVAVLPRAACDFAYRKSVFQRPDGVAALPWPPADVRSFGGIQDSTDQKTIGVVLTRVLLQCDKFSTEKAGELNDQAKALLARRHQTQPKLRSAGSIFKNPPADFAGRLIERAGLKGFCVGGAEVSPVHANFIVNLGGATAADVVAVADHVVRTVQDTAGVTLEWEVRRVGVFGERR